MLASGSTDSSVRLWDVQSGQCLQVLTEHKGGVRSVSFSADGQQLASGSEDKTVRVWNLQGQCLRILKGHSQSVYSVHFATDRQTLASSSNDATVRIWDVSNGNCLSVLQGHTSGVQCVRYSPDGQLLASGCRDGSIRLWSGDCSHNRPSKPSIINSSVKLLQGHTDWVWNIAFSPDGDWLASASLDGTLRLWSVQDEQPIHVLEGHTHDVFGLAISADSQFLVSTGCGVYNQMAVCHRTTSTKRFPAQPVRCHHSATSALVPMVKRWRSIDMMSRSLCGIFKLDTLIDG